MKSLTKFTVMHSCGHEAAHGFSGSELELSQRKEWLQRRPCQACWRAQESGSAEVKNQQMNLPSLDGTEQDKAWAEVIRLKAVTHNRDYHQRLINGQRLAQEDEAVKSTIQVAAQEALRDLESQSNAAWWIENRFEALTFVKSRVLAAISPMVNRKQE